MIRLAGPTNSQRLITAGTVPAANTRSRVAGRIRRKRRAPSSPAVGPGVL
jgi:hypothetical protein